MKKVLVVLLAGLMALSMLTACGPKKPNDSNSSGAPDGQSSQTNQSGSQNSLPPNSKAVEGSSVEQELYKAIENSINLLQKEDIGAYLDTLTGEAKKSFEEMRDTMQLIFDNQDLSYVIENHKFLKTDSETDAQVEITQLVKQASGDLPFDDNRVVRVYHLTKEDGTWKIFSYVEVSQEKLPKDEMSGIE